MNEQHKEQSDEMKWAAYAFVAIGVAAAFVEWKRSEYAAVESKAAMEHGYEQVIDRESGAVLWKHTQHLEPATDGK